MRERVRGVQTLLSRERECKGGQPLVPGPSPCVLSFAQDDIDRRRNAEISYETPQIHRFILELFPLCHDVRDTSLSRFSAVAFLKSIIQVKTKQIIQMLYLNQK